MLNSSLFTLHYRDDGALAVDDADRCPCGDVVARADGLPLVAVYLYVAVAALGDGLCYAPRATYQCIGIRRTVGLVLVQPAQGYRTDEDDAEQREDGKDEYLPVDAQPEDCRDQGEHGADGEADDEEVARRKLQNQADDSDDRPYLPHVLKKIFYHNSYIFWLSCAKIRNNFVPLHENLKKLS